MKCPIRWIVLIGVGVAAALAAGVCPAQPCACQGARPIVIDIPPAAERLVVIPGECGLHLRFLRRVPAVGQCEPIAAPKPEPIVVRLPEVVSTSVRRHAPPRAARGGQSGPRPAAAAKPCPPRHRPARHAMRLRWLHRRACRHR